MFPRTSFLHSFNASGSHALPVQPLLRKFSQRMLDAAYNYAQASDTRHGVNAQPKNSGDRSVAVASVSFASTQAHATNCFAQVALSPRRCSLLQDDL